MTNEAILDSTKNRYQRFLLTLGHATTDTCQSAVPALLPFLISSLGLGYAQAAIIVLCSNIVSTIVQPLFGYLGDKIQRPWYMALGMLFSGLGVAIIGLAGAYLPILAGAFLTGVGAALFHPEGGKLANVLSSSARKGKGISDFAVGGNLGFAAGPVLIATLVPLLGMGGCLVFLVPTTAVALLVVSQNGYYKSHSSAWAQKAAHAASSGTQDDWPGFIKVTIVNLVRSIIGSGLMVFIPLYWAHVFMQPESLSSLMLTLYSGSGAVATFLGGRVADRLGFKRVILISVCVLTPVLVLFLLVSDPFIAGALVVIAALALSLGYSPMVALGQSYLPNHLGLSSGISLGIVVSMGGISTPAIGYVGDLYGLGASMAVICAGSFVALAAALILQRKTRREKQAEG
ncbi:MAG: MFS transporter [Coriobacteriales bacterium]|jgi:FSR family fosmidomycin resistance protein-like MFS transporter|nr:MFS transporter [Coriobacteriales bacterium]